MKTLFAALALSVALASPAAAWEIEDREAAGNGDFNVGVRFPGGDYVVYLAGCADRTMINLDNGGYTEIRKAGPKNPRERDRYNIWYSACRGIDAGY